MDTTNTTLATFEEWVDAYLTARFPDGHIDWEDGVEREVLPAYRIARDAGLVEDVRTTREVSDGELWANEIFYRSLKDDNVLPFVART